MVPNHSQISAAIRAGKSADAMGLPASSNPHRKNHDFELHEAWLSGWSGDADIGLTLEVALPEPILDYFVVSGMGAYPIYENFKYHNFFAGLVGFISPAVWVFMNS